MQEIGRYLNFDAIPKAAQAAFFLNTVIAPEGKPLVPKVVAIIRHQALFQVVIA
ncbi:MAG: hypothetical protein KY428_11155 [Bacteroidetes bacterium]|nr:hypothetical protein [Bacteroidota bacterium]